MSGRGWATPARRFGWATLLGLLLALVMAPLARAAEAEPGYAVREAGVHVLDTARVVSEDDEASVEAELAGLLEETGIDLVVYTQTKERVGTHRDAQQDAEALLADWGVGGESGLGAVMFWNINEDGSVSRSGVALGQGFAGLDEPSIDENVNEVIKSATRDGDWESALRIGVRGLQNLILGQEPLAVPSPTPTPSPPPGATTPPLRPTTTQGVRPTTGLRPAAGPSYPEPIDGVRVYDYAEIISPDVIDRLGAGIDAIEARTGAQIVIYTQVKPEGNDAATTERDAAALIDQWGVGRQGFDDGMAIFFNLLGGDDRCHGQVQLYAAPGFAASYLTNGERQGIYEGMMLPALRRCDFDAALLAAMSRIDEAATAEHARDLQLARQVDAVAGIIVAPLLLLGLVAWAGWSWLRFGRDPVYLDDASILMPAPPPGMSPAAATTVIDGRAGRRALTTALVDLAARGEISFRASEADRQGIAIDITVPDQRDARLARNRREPHATAEQFALAELRRLGGAIRTIDPDEVPGFAKAVPGFEDRLDDHVAARGWFRESPGDAIDRWTRRGATVLIGGVAGVFLGFHLPSSGLLLVGAAAVAGAVAILIISRTMPQRTMEGARVFAQLAAYRRTLQRTLEQSRTMDQVVASRVLPWVETPDQAVLWAYALGLHEEAEEVLERSLEDVRTGSASPTRTYFPLWYAIGERSGARISGGAKAPTSGLFSSGVVPDFTAMTAALATIGSAPSSSGGGSGGGFGGGGSGGGGGGAGGGF